MDKHVRQQHRTFCDYGMPDISLMLILALAFKHLLTSSHVTLQSDALNKMYIGSTDSIRTAYLLLKDDKCTTNVLLGFVTKINRSKVTNFIIRCIHVSGRFFQYYCQARRKVHRLATIKIFTFLATQKLGGKRTIGVGVVDGFLGNTQQPTTNNLPLGKQHPLNS